MAFELNLPAAVLAAGAICIEDNLHIREHSVERLL
jgi:hypothetical protein